MKMRSLTVSIVMSLVLRGVESLCGFRFGWWGVLLGVVVAVVLRAHRESSETEAEVVS